jgi:pimeloyl-ACP methyl ester carboxylesterase
MLRRVTGSEYEPAGPGDGDPAEGGLSRELTGRVIAADYRLNVLHGAGHWLQFERAEGVSQLLIDWITFR